jgi:uncharacterized protein (DUF983 family)
MTNPYAAGALGRCPRCGQGALFKGFLGLQPACPACGVSFAASDSSEGPAVFIILGAGALMVGLALWAEVTFSPPLWLHLLIFMPLTLAVCLGLLRPLKALMIHQQYRTRAEQGRFGR